MSAISISIPPQESITGGPPKAVKNSAANPLSGYRISTNKEDSVRRIILPENLNARTKVWMSQELSIYPNSEYAYDISPIAPSLFWDKGCRGISESLPLSMIFAILTHCLNTTAINNSRFMTDCQWFSLDTSIKGLVHMAPLYTSPDAKVGPTPF